MGEERAAGVSYLIGPGGTPPAGAVCPGAGADGEAMFRHACAMGLEGIVSKRVTTRYKVGLVHRLGEGQEPGLRAAVTAELASHNCALRPTDEVGASP